MSTTTDASMVADVKCYFCGHISGRYMIWKDGTRKLSRFIPRPGSHMQVVRGQRLRCERCNGPVFLEDTTPIAAADAALARSLNGPADGDSPKAA